MKRHLNYYLWGHVYFTLVRNEETLKLLSVGTRVLQLEMKRHLNNAFLIPVKPFAAAQDL